MEAHDPVIKALCEALRGRKDVRLALLFGSRARGVSRPGSDADVAVLGENLDLLELAADLSHSTKVEVDVVSLEDPGYPLLTRSSATASFFMRGRRLVDLGSKPA